MPSPIANVLKNFNIYVDGRGFAGNAEEVQLPALTIQTEDFRAGGLDAPIGIDMGMEKLECSFKLSAHDPDALTYFGGGPGAVIPVEFRGALEDLNGAVSAVRVICRGTMRSIESDAWTAGQRAGKTFTMDLRYYRYTHNGATIHEIDVENMVRIVNGEDRLAAQRRALGI